MFKKFYLFAIIFALFSTISAFAQMEEGFENAVSSNLTKVSLPANALRMSPEKVPAEITNTLEKFVAAGEGKFLQGDSEVLVWTGSSYQKVGLQTTINRLMDTMKVAGWKYEVGGTENGVTVFSLLKDGKQRRAIMGFYGESDGTLVLGWVEVLPNNSGADNSQNTEQTETISTTDSNSSIIGNWYNGRVSTVTRQNTITGMTSPGSSNRFEYQFMANGKFLFTGLAQTVNYSCTDTLYNEKSGSYTINGSQIKLTLTKNFWRKQSSCAPSSNSERNYKLDPETYTFRIKRNEYGKDEVCLNSGTNEACYERTKK